MQGLPCLAGGRRCISQAPLSCMHTAQRPGSPGQPVEGEGGGERPAVAVVVWVLMAACGVPRPGLWGHSSQTCSPKKSCFRPPAGPVVISPPSRACGLLLGACPPALIYYEDDSNPTQSKLLTNTC
jgi:hypothetical protein